MSSFTSSKILRYFLIIFVICASDRGGYCDAFASMMAAKYCSRSMDVGTTIMGQAVVMNDERHIVMTDNANDENEGPDLAPQQLYYTPGQEIQFTLSPKILQSAWETNGPAKFKRGKCDGSRRSSDRSPTLEINSDATGPIHVAAVWAKSYGAGVQLAPAIILQPAVTAEHDS